MKDLIELYHRQLFEQVYVREGHINNQDDLIFFEQGASQLVGPTSYCPPGSPTNGGRGATSLIVLTAAGQVIVSSTDRESMAVVR